MTRRRALALAALLLTVLLGLASRRWPGALSPVFGKYPGDALWALAVFWLWRALRPAAPTTTVALLAAATALGVELAKLWQAPWLVAFRHTTAGHLLLGHVFSGANLLAYAVGVLAGAAFDRLLVRARPA